MIFKTAPTDFDKKMDVVACYLEHDGRFVLLHRPAHKSSGNKWGRPAGKVDAGEDIATAMQREIQEETGVSIVREDLRHFDTVFVRAGGNDIEYHMFSYALEIRPDIKINPGEHQSYTWVLPQEAIQMDLVHDLDECIEMFYGTMK